MIKAIEGGNPDKKLLAPIAAMMIAVQRIIVTTMIDVCIEEFNLYGAFICATAGLFISK